GMSLGCSSSGPKGTRLGPSPRIFTGFPPQKSQDTIYASARYDADAMRTFGGVDLVDHDGVLPVELTFRLRGKDSDSKVVMVEPNRIDLRLYLPDGTALIPADADRIAEGLRDEHASHVRGKKLIGGLLDEATDHTGYIFFKLKPRNRFSVDGRQVRHVTGGIEHELNLTNSLLAFNLNIGGESRAMYVGIQ
ncbi:MAG: hypothetical protein ACI841_003173, partial [Planctomycetota bacterium]